MEPPTAHTETEAFLREFFEGFIHMEFSQENFPCDTPGECGSFFDNDLGAENLTQESAEKIVDQCSEFISQNFRGLELLIGLGLDAFFCGQGFSLAKRGDKMAFSVSAEAPPAVLKLQNSAQTYPIFLYEIGVDGIWVEEQ